MGKNRKSANRKWRAGIKLLLGVFLLALFLPCLLPAQESEESDEKVPSFTKADQTFPPLSLRGGLTEELIEIVVNRWGEVPPGDSDRKQKFTVSIANQPSFLTNIQLLEDPAIVFGPDENRKTLRLQFDTVEADQLGESDKEEELVIVIKADDPGIIPEERRLIIPFTIGARPERPRVSAYPLKPDAPDSFPIEEAAQYCVLDVSEINEYDKIVVFFTPKRDLNKSNPEEFRFRIKNPNGKVVCRREFVKSQPGDEERAIDLKFTRAGSPGRFAVKLNLWDVQRLPKDPAKRWHMPGKYMLETIRLKPAAGTGLWGQGQGYKEDGEWQEEGRFEVKDGRIHFAGFVTEPLKNRSLPRTKWRWDGETNIEKLKVDIEKGDVCLDVSSWWQNTKRRDDGTFGPGDKISRGQTHLTMVFPQSIRPGKVVQKLDRLGSFRYPLEPVAEVDIEWTVEGDDNAIYTPVFLRPVPFRGPPSRQAPSEGWGGRSVIDQSLDVPKAILNKAWMPARDRKCVYRVGVCDHYKPFGVPSRTLAWHLHDSDSLWLFPVKFTLASDVEFYGYGIYRSLTGPYDGPQPEEPPWGKTGSASDDEAGPGGVQTPDEEGEDVPDTDEETGSVAETDADVVGEDVPGLPGTDGEARSKPIDPNTLDPNSTDVAGKIREWVSVAEPPENAIEGNNFHYSNKGNIIGTAAGGVIESRHETGAFDPVFLWKNRRQLDSINHCTMEEYVVAKLEQKSISHCIGRYGAVKDLKGEQLAKAKATVNNAGFEYSLIPGSPAKTPEMEGTIERQEPDPEKYLKKGQILKLTVHSPYVPGRVTLPDFTGKSIKGSKKWLQGKKLQVRLQAGSPAPTSKKSGTIEKQEPVPGTTVKAGSAVTLTAHSNFVDVSLVPGVVGVSVGKAKTRIVDAGFKVKLRPGGKPSSREQAGTVERQSPDPGTKAATSSEVSIFVYGPYADTTVVPDVRRLSYDDARRRLEAAGLSVGRREAGKPSNSGLANTAHKQEPPSGTEVSRGKTVLVWFYGQYVPTREEQVAKTDCSKYPGSRAYWDDAAGKPKCGCFDGLQWNLSKSRCVSPDVYAREACTRNYPGSIARGRTADGRINCVCPDGYQWAYNPRRCVKQASGGGGSRDWRGWDRNQQCDHMISRIKNFMDMYRRDPRNNSHLKGIAEGDARQARNFGCDLGKINQALGTGGSSAGGTTGTGGGRGRSIEDICPCVDENGRRYRVPFGQDCGTDLGIMSRDYNCSGSGGSGVGTNRTGGGSTRKKTKSDCYEIDGSWKGEGNIVQFTTRDGVNYEGRFTSVSSHWQRFGYRTGELGYRVKKTSKTNWKGQALIHYSNGTSKWVSVIISAHSGCGRRQFHIQGKPAQNWRRIR